MGKVFVGWCMRDLLRKAEHYRELAVKYHELAKVAQPAYLGDFYRGVAVRYVFMAQEASERASKDVGFTAEPSGLPNAECGGGHPGSVGLDLDLLAVWAGDGLRSGELK
jgi:hypothetical protein